MNSESVPLVNSNPSVDAEMLAGSDALVGSDALAGSDALVGSEPLESSEPLANADPFVNYDSDPVLEIELDGMDYRLDPGKQGTALCISKKETGSWDWAFVGEAKWDASSLRCKELERPIRENLAKALRELSES